MKNKIILGDCLEVMKELQDQSIDMILCDLPYGMTNCKWDIVIPFDLLWEQYKRIIKENGCIALFGTEPFSSIMRTSNLKMYKYDWYWRKDRGTNFLHARKQPLRNIETISIFYKKQCIYNPQKTIGKPYTKRGRTKSDLYNIKINTITENTGDRYPLTLIQFNKEKNVPHPTQKPVKLLEYLIETYTNENELILDNCMGAGSTCVAAKNKHRNYIGIEKEEKYFEIAKQRLKR